MSPMRQLTRRLSVARYTLSSKSRSWMFDALGLFDEAAKTSASLIKVGMAEASGKAQ